MSTPMLSFGRRSFVSLSLVAYFSFDRSRHSQYWKSAFFISVDSQGMASEKSSSHPLLTFGIVSDIQYADFNNGTDYSNTNVRYYRNSVNLLKKAIEDWNCSQSPLSFVIQLGDLIDGRNKRLGSKEESKKALDTILHTFQLLQVPVYHLLGNHEFYNFDRSFYLHSPLHSALAVDLQSGVNKFYYSFSPHPKLRFIAVDSYEVSVLGYTDDSENENYLKAKELLHQHNHNENKISTTGLIGFERRWASFNGGLSHEQLQWLTEALRKAQSQEENVIILSHIGIQTVHREYTTCLLWNYKEVMDIIHNFSCVIAVLAGHEHSGYYGKDDHGVHHITFPGLVETHPEDNAYGTANLWHDKLMISGVGRVSNFEVDLRFRI